jgi:delta-aminolevulinic acid dehydratase/porphobilinogen synthase
MEFPVTRMRRLRRTAGLRALVRETRLEPGGLVYPLFVCPGEGVRREVSSMPGVFNLSIDEAVKEAESAAALGVGGLMLFGLPAEKDEEGSGAWADDGIVQSALRALKRERGLDGLVMIADVCLCEYTSHGHCGVVRRTSSAGVSAGVGAAGGRADASHTHPSPSAGRMGHPADSELGAAVDAGGSGASSAGGSAGY